VTEEKGFKGGYSLGKAQFYVSKVNLHTRWKQNFQRKDPVPISRCARRSTKSDIRNAAEAEFRIQESFLCLVFLNLWISIFGFWIFQGDRPVWYRLCPRRYLLAALFVLVCGFAGIGIQSAFPGAWPNPHFIVETDWLEKNLQDSNLAVIHIAPANDLYANPTSAMKLRPLPKLGHFEQKTGNFPNDFRGQIF